MSSIKTTAEIAKRLEQGGCTIRPKQLFGFGVFLMLVAILASAVLGCVTTGGTAQQSGQQPTLEWFGWSHFRITTTDGTVFLINPWVTGNPDSSVALDDITTADYILVANGHRDEQGDTIAIARKTGAQVLGGGFELGSWFIQNGVPREQVIRSNPGNWHNLGGVTVRVVNSVHGSGLPETTIIIPPSARLTVELGTTPADSITFGGTLIFREVG